MSTDPNRRFPHGRAAQAVVALLCAALGCASATARADGTVYKWVDAQNNVHYSDRPPPDTQGPVVTLNTGYGKNSRPADGGNRGAHGAAPAPAAAGAPAAPRAQNPAQSAAEKKVAADLAAAHADDCKKAQTAYDTYIRSRRLYKAGDNNDRVYLSEAETEQARVDARREVDAACGPSAP